MKSRGVLFTIAAVGVIVLGVAARLFLFLARPSFWGDELLLLLNVVRRSYAGLLTPLDHAQIAPVLFVELEKLSLSLLGVSEFAARLFPLLFGLAAIVLVGCAVRQIASREAAMWAAVVTSVSPALLLFTNEAKQYSAEAATSAVVLVVCLSQLRKPFRYRGLTAVFCASIAALLLSVPAIFVVAPAWAAVLLHCRKQKDSFRLQLGVCGAALASAGIFAGLYFGVYSGNGVADYMQGFWAPAYLRARGSWWAGFTFLMQTLASSVLALDGGLPGWLVVVAVLLLAWGFVRLAVKAGWPVTVLLAGPLVLVLAANLVVRWPLAIRLMTFAIPVLVVVMSYGMEPLLNFRGVGSFLAAGAVSLVLIVPSLRLDFWQVRHPESADDCREKVKSLMERVRPADAVYVYAGGVPAWLYYSVNWAAPNWARVNTWEEASKRLGGNPGNAPPRNARVQHEGWDLTFPVNGHVELMGIASGSQSDGAGYHGAPPDEGWADNEAERMVSCGRERVYVFVSQYRKPVIDPLMAALERRGMRLVEKNVGISRWYEFER